MPQILIRTNNNNNDLKFISSDPFWNMLVLYLILGKCILIFFFAFSLFSLSLTVFCFLESHHASRHFDRRIKSECERRKQKKKNNNNSNVKNKPFKMSIVNKIIRKVIKILCHWLWLNHIKIFFVKCLVGAEWILSFGFNSLSLSFCAECDAFQIPYVYN